MVYPPRHFAVDDVAETEALLAAYPFAVIVVDGADGMVSVRTPVIAERGPDGRVTALLGHVSRANPVWQAAGEGAAALALFQGPHAYVSASAYPSKAEHGKAVPTWNYVGAEVRGRVTAFDDPVSLRAFLDALTARFEDGRVEPWTVDDAPDGYVSALIRGIVGLRLDVEQITAIKKLSQNKAKADFEGVLAFLDAEPDASAGDTASQMRQLELD